MTAGRLLALLSIAALATGCVRFGYWVRHVEEPIPQEALLRLRPGVDDLGDCLGILGAPHFVWEYRQDGMALAWVSLDGSEWDFDLSYAFERFANTSLSLDMGGADLPGVVLWLDAELRLLRWQRGRMRDLIPTQRLRPAVVDGDPHR